MKRTSWILILFAVLVSLVAGCTAAVTSPPAASAPSNAVTAPARPASPGEWDKTLPAARQEGTVVVYTTLAMNMRDSLAPPLKQKYGVELEFVAGRTTEVLQKITAERNAGLYMADILITGSSTCLVAKDAGFTEPIERLIVLPEVKDPRLWLGGAMNFLERDNHFLALVSRPASLLAYNTEMVKPPLQSFRELLDPRWKGKIIMNDPSISGSGGLVALALGETYGTDFLKSLAKQDLLITRDQRLQVEWIARGKYPLGTGPSTEVVTEFAEAGAPIRFGNPTDHVFTSSGSGFIGAIKKAPHPNAARVFVNWFLTNEGQTILSKGIGVPSRRLDVSTEFISSDKLLDPKKKYVDTETEEMSRKRLYWQDIAKEIFASYLK